MTGIAAPPDPEVAKLRYGVIRVGVMRLPTFDALTPRARLALAGVDRAWKAIQPRDLEGLRRWLAADPANDPAAQPIDPRRFEHPLSDHISMLTQTGPRPRRTLGELALLDADVPAPADALGSIQAFQGLLLSLSGALGGPVELRTVRVGVVRDAAGNRIVYPPVSRVRPQLAALHGFLPAALDRSPAFAATVAMNALCNIHPLSDGNGRLSRAVFSWLMNSAGGSPYYLPLYELSAFSRGGFTICLRAAQYHGDWEPLALFIAEGVDALLSLSSAISRRSPSRRDSAPSTPG